MISSSKKGFTLIELILYVAVTTLIITAVSALLLWGIKLRAKAQVQGEVVKQAERAMAIMLREVREAKGIYAPTSQFGTSQGQLSLQTLRYIPEGENFGYIDFFLCGTRLCIKKEFQNPVAITSENTLIEELVFDLVGADSKFPSIQIALIMKYNTQAQRPEYNASINFQSSAVLRAPN